MKFVVAGFGKFGRLAVERLRKFRAGTEILIIEQEAVHGQRVPWEQRIILGDAAEVIADSSELEPDDIIIPMVPFNLAAEYVLRKNRFAQKTSLPTGIVKLLPNPYVLDEFNLACSNADFLCPDNCPEGELCTVTGTSRVPLYDRISQISLPDCGILVQQSVQIMPGIGGYSFASICELENRLARGRSLIATACKCHAILTSIESIKAESPADRSGAFSR